MNIKIVSKPVGHDVIVGKIYKVVAEYGKFFTIINDSNGTLDVLKDDCEVINCHPHASLIMIYAEIAQLDSKPWTYFQVLSNHREWKDCNQYLYFSHAKEYRLKPRTININGFEVPEPLRNIPPCGTEYFLIDFLKVNDMTWTDYDDELNWLKAGLIHTTRENAEKHLEALLSFTKE